MSALYCLKRANSLNSSHFPSGRLHYGQVCCDVNRGTLWDLLILNFSQPNAPVQLPHGARTDLEGGLGHADGAGVDLAGAVVVDGAALPHAKVGGAVRPLDVEDLRGFEKESAEGLLVPYIRNNIMHRLLGALYYFRAKSI